MATSTTRIAGRRADDVRALRIRYRDIQFTGSYAAGGETIQAASVSLKRVLGVIPLDSMVRVAGAVTGYAPAIDVAADGRSFVIRHIGDGAGVSTAALGAQRANGAYTANEHLQVLIVGEG